MLVRYVGAVTALSTALVLGAGEVASADHLVSHGSFTVPGGVPAVFISAGQPNKLTPPLVIDVKGVRDLRVEYSFSPDVHVTPVPGGAELPNNRLCPSTATVNMKVSYSALAEGESLRLAATWQEVDVTGQPTDPAREGQTISLSKLPQGGAQDDIDICVGSIF